MGWPGHYTNVRHCGGLSKALSSTKRPLGTTSEVKEFLPGSEFLSHRDMTRAVESDVNPFLPSFFYSVTVSSACGNTH